MATQEYLYPKVPEKDKDGNLVADDIVKFCRNILELFKTKVSKDNKNNEDTEESINNSRGVGSWYVQYPSVASNDEDTAFPEAERPASLFGGTWTEMFDDEAIFFRTFGESEPRTNGLQKDAGQQIYGVFNTGTADFGYFTSASGVFTLTTALSKRPSGSTSATMYRDITFNSANSTYPNAVKYSATETRAKNRRIKVWYRES